MWAECLIKRVALPYAHSYGHSCGGLPTLWLASAAVARLLLALRPWLALAFTPVGFRAVGRQRLGSTSRLTARSKPLYCDQRLYPALLLTIIA